MFYFQLMDFIYSYYWIIQLLLLTILAMSLAGNWLVFQKMGEPGWKGIIPIYNMVILFEKLYGNRLYVLAYLLGVIPLVGGLIAFAVYGFTQARLALSFRKGVGFAVGLILCAPLFTLILGLDESTYHPLPPFKI